MTTEMSPTTYARIAGILYLAIAIIAAFAIGYVPSTIVVSGDAAATAANLAGNTGLFAGGIAGDVAIILIEIALSVMLYRMFRQVSPTLAMISMIGRLMEVAVMAINVLISTMALLVVRPAGETITSDTQSLVMLLLDAHAYGIYVWDILFGFSLAALGILVVRSGQYPRLLGWAMALGSIGYLAEGLSRITFIEAAPLGIAIVALLTVATIAELSFALWLLIRGPKQPAGKTGA
jgi:hypothetical protein